MSTQVLPVLETHACSHAHEQDGYFSLLVSKRYFSRIRTFISHRHLGLRISWSWQPVFTANNAMPFRWSGRAVNNLSCSSQSNGYGLRASCSDNRFNLGAEAIHVKLYSSIHSFAAKFRIWRTICKPKLKLIARFYTLLFFLISMQGCQAGFSGRLSSFRVDAPWIFFRIWFY